LSKVLVLKAPFGSERWEIRVLAALAPPVPRLWVYVNIPAGDVMPVIRPAKS
jgi:hypothetical protein